METDKDKQMFTEEFVLGAIKHSEHGIKFSTTAQQILETIVERVWFEDSEGVEFIEKISVVINNYANFELRQAFRGYEAMNEELKTFISKLRDNQESEVRVNTWVKIDSILNMLVIEGGRFLEIAGSEVTRLQTSVTSAPVQ